MLFQLEPHQTSKAVNVVANSAVVVTPAAGATARVEYTTDTTTNILNGTATWTVWSYGTVSVMTRDTAMASAGDIHIRVTAEGGEVAVDVHTQVEESSSLASGGWLKVPTVFRLRLTGTGTCVIDSRNRLGVVSAAIASFSPSGATNQIEYPYPGDDAVEIRATLTGTCKAEVL